MFKLYREKIYDPQIRWIRNHPVQYIALNAILLAAGIGYVEYKERKEMRKWQNEVAEEIV